MTPMQKYVQLLDNISVDELKLMAAIQSFSLVLAKMMLAERVEELYERVAEYVTDKEATAYKLSSEKLFVVGMEQLMKDDAARWN